jgi:Ca2+-transporting ATPase
VMKKPPRRAGDMLITPWVFFRYCIVGAYVGLSTVGIFVYWYVYYDGNNDGHTLVTYDQLSHWGQCSHWEGFTVNDFNGRSYAEDPCSYFTAGKDTASTLSLSVLVTIEMLNALNALSEDCSLLTVYPWANPWLLLSMVVSFGMHFVILYVPWLCNIFSLEPLTWNDWMLVLAFSFPVIVIDEVLKFWGRIRNKKVEEQTMRALKAE